MFISTCTDIFVQFSALYMLGVRENTVHEYIQSVYAVIVNNMVELYSFPLLKLNPKSCQPTLLSHGSQIFNSQGLYNLMRETSAKGKG